MSVLVRASGVESYLEASCESILSSGRYPRREIIVSGGEVSNDLAVRLQSIGVSLAAPGEHGNGADIAALEIAEGDIIVSITGDLQICSADWLEHLVFNCELPGVGCVTPLILSSEGTVSSAGLIIGRDGIVGRAMCGYQPDGDGYAGSLSCAREVSAVPADCYAISRRILATLGGLDPYYAGAANAAADISIRALSRGLHNICTPRVVLRSLAGVAPSSHDDLLDRLLLTDAWESLLDKGDPFHNRNFEQAAPGYRE